MYDKSLVASLHTGFLFETVLTVMQTPCSANYSPSSCLIVAVHPENVNGLFNNLACIPSNNDSRADKLNDCHPCAF